MMRNITNILTDQTSNYSNINSFKNTIQLDYNAMVESVDKYGGFYVGRYESSVDDSDSNNKTVKSTKGATSMYGRTWYELYAREKNFSTNYVQGSMIWGSQYDAMMNWMLENSINVASPTPIPGAIKNEDRTTGTEEADKLNNVYDLLGNSCEFSLDAYNTNGRARWGGNSYISNSPSTRSYDNSNGTFSRYSSRLTFYIK